MKSVFRLRGRKRSTIAYTNDKLQRFLVPSVQSCFMQRDLRHMIYQLNYGIEYLGLGKVMCYQQKVSTQIVRVPRTYVTENKEVPDRNIGVPPVRKYANYRILYTFVRTYRRFR
jgi:hypothetical protein